ncbi:MAG: cytochrome c biogenesis protein CcsA [Armatimonadetes bacterium]|nr:cytochrome c biogenesis protein CcsA [Armatimonadota bacterium]
MDSHPALNLPDAPQWAMFLGQFGKISVYMVLIACTLALVLSLLDNPKTAQLRRNAFYLACIGFFAVFISLATLFVKDQFQFQYVFNHSSKDNPISYKIASVWTAQQGSFLLWAVYGSLFGLLTVAKTKSYERWYTVAYMVFLGSLAGILAYDSPFNIFPDLIANGKTMIPPEGSGMVPGLQNYWVVIHPPIIFLGFGSLTVPFAYGVAAMLSGNATDWIKQCRAPVLFGLSVLGLGISLGGLWAYETQGWGGFWAWDPVENVSLVPWLFMVALSHGIIAQSAKGIWKSANLFLSGLPFVSFVYGTFLTRSGLLDKVSVHSFASMDGTARSILKYFLWGLVIAFAVLFAMKGTKIGKSDEAKPAADTPGYNRASFYQLGTLSLCLMAFVISIGMSWPVITALRGGQGAAVEAGVYHKSVFWFFGAVMLAMAIAPFVSWKKEQLKSILGRFWTLGSISLGLVGVFLLLPKLSPDWGIRIEPGATADGFWKGSTIPLQFTIAVLLFFCTFVAITNMWRAVELARKSKLGIGPFIAHFGIAVMLSGLIISKGLERTDKTVVREGEPSTALGYKIAFKDYNPDKYYDRSNVVKFDVIDPEGKQHEIDPNLYYYQSGDQDEAQTWPYIERSWSHDMYFFMQKPEVEFFDTPITLKPGEKKVVGKDMTIEYTNLTHKGQLGAMGVQFLANVKVSYAANSHSAIRTYEASPSLKMTENGLQPDLPVLSPDFRIAMTAMNANDKSVNIQLFWAPPLYPIQIFYKPLTCLVWIGTGIFTIGGLLSAFYRRMVVKAPEGEFVEETAKMTGKDGNAPLATA